MADNITVKDASGNTVTVHTKDDGAGKQTPQSILSKSDGTVLVGQQLTSASIPVTLPSDGVITPGTAATNLGKAEDVPHVSGDVGVMALGVRSDTPAATAGTTGDYQPPIYDALGRQWTINGGCVDYKTVAASQTNTVMGATGATGDYLSHVLVVPATTSPGAVSITDGSGSAITIFTGGSSSVSNLVPFAIPVGAKSGSGAWKITTGTNVSVIGVGKFT